MPEHIPRRIIQVWGSPSLPSADLPVRQSSELPLFARASAANLRLLNPGFEYLFFDEPRIERFIDSDFPQYRPVFDGFSARIQRYDFFRYLAIYRLGGFYFDTDVFLAHGLEDLLQFGCVFPFEHLSIHRFLSEQYGMDWEVGNYGFGAAAGHPFIGAVINNVIRAQREPEWPKPMLRSIPRMFRSVYSILNTTGPSLVSRTLAEYQGAHDEVKVLFPEDVRDESNWYRFGEYGVHLQNSSWRKRERLVPRVLHRYWLSATRSMLSKKNAKRGAQRSLDFERPVVRSARRLRNRAALSLDR
jgi:inositol phosphorylceramide mannosyltransferase catalytic subunit